MKTKVGESMPTRKRTRKQIYKSTVNVGDTEMRKQTERIERTDRVPSFSTDVFGVAIMVFIFSAAMASIIFWRFDESWLLGIAFGAFLAAAVVIWRTRTVYDPKVDIEETTWVPAEKVVEVVKETEPEPLTSLWVKIPAGPGRQLTFKEPRPGEFARWIGRVIDDHFDDNVPFGNKVTLSQRTAIKRGWTRDMHQSMTDGFYECGWIFEGRNRIPEPTTAGVQAWQNWLSFTVPAPKVD
jgi:hypothetical protein